MRTRASFRLWGDDARLTAEAVSRKLGVEPTAASEAGDRVGHRSTARRAESTEHAVEIDRKLMQRLLALPGDLWLDVCGHREDEDPSPAVNDRVAPAWMHGQITAEEYASWSEDQCVGIEIVDGMVIVSPIAPKRHHRLARMLANALDAAAGPDWNADTDFDVRLQDVPLTNRRPDVVVYRADTIDITPARPDHVLLAAEIVSAGSETTDRIVKLDQYARAGIPFYWRVELTAAHIPVVYTYLLDSASRRYRESDVFTGFVKATVPFPVDVDLSELG